MYIIVLYINTYYTHIHTFFKILLAVLWGEDYGME